LWSEASPQREEQLRQARVLCGSPSAITETTARSPAVKGDLASVRIDRVMGVVPGAPDAGPVTKRLVIEFVRERGQWKIRKETPVAEDVAARLAAAGPEFEASLLAENQDLPASDLAPAVTEKGRELRNHGALPQALRMHELARTIAQRGNAPQAEAQALNNIGLVHYDQGDYPEALDKYGASLALSRSLHDDTGAARALNNMSAVYMDTVELSLSWNNLEQALALSEKSHADRLRSNAIGNMAIIQGKRGDYIDSLRLLERAYEFDKGTGDKRALAIDLIDLGEVFNLTGQLPASAKPFRTIGRHCGFGRSQAVDGNGADECRANRSGRREPERRHCRVPEKSYHSAGGRR
jgi:tetratricopeptide (TPR) repeat protein